MTWQTIITIVAAFAVGLVIKPLTRAIRRWADNNVLVRLERDNLRKQLLGLARARNGLRIELTQPQAEQLELTRRRIEQAMQS